MSYSKLLKSPKWQKKRLKIFKLDNWTCQGCGSKDNSLQVHHLKYNGKKPWQIQNKYLITFCEYCHKSAHTFTKNNSFIERLISLNNRKNG